MYWQLTPTTHDAPPEPAPAGARRFVLHRHRDGAGPHLDLRLEQEECLLGWRIDDDQFAATVWATEKAPHPCRWLEEDADAVREDAGVYAWHTRDAPGGELWLWGRRFRTVQVAAQEGIAPAQVRDIAHALHAEGLPAGRAAQLVQDGVTARRRAIARFCGLGRELDGRRFDESVWRRTLASLDLQEIQQHLSAYESRFDAKYPPHPVTRPESLDNDASATREEQVLRILNS